MRAPDLRRSGRRLRVARALLLLAFAGLALRAVHLTVVDVRGAERGDAQTSTALRLAPARGAIVDRGGAALVVTVEAPSVYAVPRRLEDPEAAAGALAPLLGLAPERLRRRLDGHSGFVFLRRWVDAETAAAVRELGLPGVGLVDEPRRAHPHRSLAGPLLGFANIDGEGVRGIEQMEDAWLRGEALRIAVERDARRRLLVRAGVDPREAAGGDVALTLDATLQAEVTAALERVVETTGARGGAVLMMDPHTGAVRAAAQRPAFDPSRFRHTPYAETRARIFLDAREPGSALKPFTVAAALEAGVLAPDETIDCEDGSFRVPGRTLRDLHPHQQLDPAGVLRVSSNIGAAKIGFRLGPERHHAALRRFGFGDSTGSGFPDESAGLLRPSEAWRPLDHATISFGHGINVTMAQLASAYAALANGGVLRPPRLVTARREPGGAWRPAPPAEGRRVLRPEVAARVLAMLEGVVSPEGTARLASLRGLRVAGKTGTAQKLDPATGSYSRSRYLAWFAGVAPADDPRLVTVVLLDEPKGRMRTGGATAAPLFARAASAGLGALGIRTEPVGALPRLARLARGDGEEQEDAPTQVAERSQPPAPAAFPDSAGSRAALATVAARAGAASAAPAALADPRPPRARPAALPTLARLGDRILVPDLRGLTEAQVRRLLTEAALPADLRGRGRAVQQSPAPGTIVAAKAARLRIRFAEEEG